MEEYRVRAARPAASDRPRSSGRRRAHAAGTDDTGARLSIGALARATGIPVETLRTWELRYGFPASERKPSGHRVYAPSIVPRLRRIAEALARGHRAGDVVPAPEIQLDEILRSGQPAPARPSRAPDSRDTTLDDLVGAVSAFDADRLTRMLLTEWARLDPMVFVEDRVVPLIEAIGDAWSTGRLQISHEHFLSERLGDLLRSLRLPFEDRATGPLVVLATLPGEAHALGLQIAALVLARAGCRILYLGTEAPIAEIADLARTRSARIVAISISIANRNARMRQQLTELRRRLPSHVVLLAGGRGADSDSRRVEIMSDFRQLDARARSLVAG